MKAPLEFWFDFASPYSYVAALRVEGLAAAAQLPLVWRPFLLGAVFQSQGLTTTPFNTQPARRSYMWRDLERVCEKYQLPWRTPSQFPQRSILACRLGCALAGEAACGEFVRATFRAEFAQGRDIAERSTMSDVLTEVGLAPEPWLTRAESPDIKALLRSFSDDAIRRGLFGAPNLLVDDELFFGQDRLDDGIAWARSH